jgi:hypothetical protein
MATIRNIIDFTPERVNRNLKQDIEELDRMENKPSEGKFYRRGGKVGFMNTGCGRKGM